MNISSARFRCLDSSQLRSSPCEIDRTAQPVNTWRSRRQYGCYRHSRTQTIGHLANCVCWRPTEK